jgi:hypothetical protein
MPYSAGRRELLERLGFLRATGMRWQKPRDLRQRGKPRRGRGGLTKERPSKLPQEENGCGLAGVIGHLPGPEAGSIGPAKRGFHRAAEDLGVDPLAAFEMWKKTMGDGQDGGRMGG